MLPSTPTNFDLSTQSLIVVAEGEAQTVLGGFPAAAPAGFSAGTLLQDRYRLERELGQGGMGLVFLGRDERLMRPVAVKVIRPQFGTASQPDSADADLKERFFNEARLGANLLHPSIATVFDFGTHEGNPFTVFEYVAGETLRETLSSRGILPLDEVQQLITQLAQALDYAHAHQIAHRDLKPENIRAAVTGQLKILDLGLAVEFCRREDWRFVGTPAYASPEQAAGEPCDGRADQYALALIAYEMLSGRRLFSGRTPLDVLALHRNAIPDIRAADLQNCPLAVVAAIQKALEKSPGNRFARCEDFALALGGQFLKQAAVLPPILCSKLARHAFELKSFRLEVPRSMNFQSLGVCLVLETGGLWCSYDGEILRWPIEVMREARPSGSYLALTLRVGRRNLTWKFDLGSDDTDYRQSRYLAAQLDPMIAQAKSRQIPATSSDFRQHRVGLVRHCPEMRFQLLGRVEFANQSRFLARETVRLQAAMLGAEGVVDLQEERLNSVTKTWRASGTAVRAIDDAGRMALNLHWFEERAGAVEGWAAAMAVSQIVMTAVVTAIAMLRESPAEAAEYFTPLLGTPVQMISNVAVQLWLIAGPVALHVLRWPQLLPAIAVNCLTASVLLWSPKMAVYMAVMTLPMSLIAARAAWRLHREWKSDFQSVQSRMPGKRQLIARVLLVLSIGFALVALCTHYQLAGEFLRNWR